MIRSLNIWKATRTSFITMFALAVIGAVTPESASAEAKRVAVLEFEGPSASAVHAQITSALKSQSSVELVSAREVKATADRLDNSLESANDYKQVAEALELSAFIEGEVEKKGHNLQATVTVRDASTGQVTHEETWARRRSGIKTIKPQVWAALGPAIKQTSKPKPAKAAAKPTKKAPPPPPPPVAEEEEEEADEEEVDEEEENEREKRRKRAEKQAREEREREEEEEEKPKKKPKKASVPGDKSVQHPALVAYFGPRIMWRTLDYEGSPSSTNFQTYSSTDEGSPSFNLALGAQWYPGAHSHSEWYSDLGLEADIDYAVGLKAKVADSMKKVSVSAYEVGIGAIYRIPLDGFEPRIRLGFVKHVFDVDLPTMPGLSYSNLRIGAGTAINLVDWLSFDVNFAYLVVLGVGELANDNYGEDVSAKAWEASGGALVRFAETWGVRAALDYRRYKYDFGLSDNPGTVLPKSGTDGYLRLTIAAVYTLPGQKK